MLNVKYQITAGVFFLLYLATQGVTKFWENFGYLSTNWKDPPNQDPKYIRKRAMQLQVTLQCGMYLFLHIYGYSLNENGDKNCLERSFSQVSTIF